MKHIPNMLSVFRIVLIPFFIWQMMRGNLTVAGVILAISALTDFFDGLLARHFGWVSQVGKVLDPAADKLTQVTVCILMIVNLRAYWPFFAVMLFKDAVMLVLGGYLLKQGVTLEGARWFGKISTILFYAVMVLIFFVPGMPRSLIITLLCLVSGAALFSAFMYIPQYLNYRKEAKILKAQRNTKE